MAVETISIKVNSSMAKEICFYKFPSLKRYAMKIVFKNNSFTLYAIDNNEDFESYIEEIKNAPSFGKYYHKEIKGKVPTYTMEGFSLLVERENLLGEENHSREQEIIYQLKELDKKREELLVELGKIYKKQLEKGK